MFFSRIEGALGYVPGLYRSSPTSRRRRARTGADQNKKDAVEFFGTATYASEANSQARKREVSRLFARMRSELLEIAHDFADASTVGETTQQDLRRGVFVEMVVASEFVAVELDARIAILCKDGVEAETNGDQEKLDQICKAALTLSRMRKRIGELQRELDSMVDVALKSFQQLSLSMSLNFDPLADDADDSRLFLFQFLQSIDEAIVTLSQSASAAIEQRDFETAAQLCSCNFQLTSFLGDAKKMLAFH